VVLLQNKPCPGTIFLNIQIFFYLCSLESLFSSPEHEVCPSFMKLLCITLYKLNNNKMENIFIPLKHLWHILLS